MKEAQGVPFRGMENGVAKSKYFSRVCVASRSFMVNCELTTKSAKESRKKVSLPSRKILFRCAAPVSVSYPTDLASSTLGFRLLLLTRSLISVSVFA